MVIDTQDLKNVATKALAAVDTSEISNITDVLELVALDKNLYVSVSNGDYFVQIRLYVGYDEEFHATVNASLFLKLIAKITSEDIELTLGNNQLIIKGNGTYKLPLLYDNDKLLELPGIIINNVAGSQFIDLPVLKDIVRYNGREMTKGVISMPSQRFYYIDEQGAITFNTGACVNSFKLDTPVKLLLTNKVVKLFKLFESEQVKMTWGHDADVNNNILTKVQFEDERVVVVAILPSDERVMASIPVNIIRERAETIYPHAVCVNKESMLQALNRLALFNSISKTLDSCVKFIFNENNVTMKDASGNEEVINYEGNNCNVSGTYEALISLNDFKITLETYDFPYLTINFGDHRAFVITKENIHVIIPESY